MDDYCAQDLEVTHTLYTNLISSGFSDESFELEMGVAAIMWRQECYGFLLIKRPLQSCMQSWWPAGKS
jgi:hypothetical protein